MNKNLETANLIVKLVLPSLAIILYFMNIISGPFAKAIMILSVIIIVVFVAKLIITKFLID